MTMKASTLAEAAKTIKNGYERVVIDLDRLRELVVKVETDQDSRPTDYDSDMYSAADRTAFGNDEWRFIGIIVSVRDGKTGSEAGSASLWGIEYNLAETRGSDYNETEYIEQVLADLVHEAAASLTLTVERAAETLAKLAALTNGKQGTQIVMPAEQSDGVCSQCSPGHDRGDGRCERHGKTIAKPAARTYERSQIERVLTDGPDPEIGGVFRLQIQGNTTSTKWLSVSADQLRRIADVLDSATE